jgi:hypothetical protein
MHPNLVLTLNSSFWYDAMMSTVEFVNSFNCAMSTLVTLDLMKNRLYIVYILLATQRDIHKEVP